MGTNKANPIALILSSTMMLRHLGLETQANAIAEATYDLIADGKVKTADMHGESAKVEARCTAYMSRERIHNRYDESDYREAGIVL